MRPIPIIAAILLALGVVEALSYWWMHPARAGLGQPVLAYRPQVGRDPARSAHLSPSARDDKDHAPISSSSSNQQSSPSSDLRPSDLQTFDSSSSLQLLPEVVSRALPALRCTTGTAARIDRDNSVTLHIAFFEWDLADSTNVLEAFKHLPEECMGAIGMKLVKVHPPRSYTIKSQQTVGRDPARSAHLSPAARDDKDQQTVGMDRRAGPLIANGAESQETAEARNQASRSVGVSPTEQRTAIENQGSGVRSQESGNADAKDSSSSSNQKSTISPLSSPSPISASQHLSVSASTSPSLSFDHTEFRDPSGVVVHAFKGTWVSGANDLLGPGVRGGADQWRQIRWKAALKRFRPAHARVAQGAVRGIRNPDLAWQAFEDAMLKDLRMER